jgi:flagellar biosynthesis protein FliQ
VLCLHPDTRFRNGCRAATKLHETTLNMTFGPKVVDWACSLRKTKKWSRWQKLMLCMHHDTRFWNGWRAATKLRETTPNMSFGPKVVDWACSLRKTKKWFWWQKLVLSMHPDYRFRNGWRAATNLRETTTNMSFGPKVVDWVCSLQKTKKCFRWQKLMFLCTWYLFSEWVTCSNEIARTHPKHEFWT